MWVCDEWGGAESRGSRARPVELMMMSDTCTTHRSRVPRRSSGRIQGGVTTVQDERGPGLDFNLCFVCGSRPWGAAALLLCLFMLLKLFKCSPVPASFFPFYELCYNDKTGNITPLISKWRLIIKLNPTLKSALLFPSWTTNQSQSSKHCILPSNRVSPASSLR